MGSRRGGVFIHTTDSGISWISQKVAPKFRLRKVEFVDENNGWAVGRDKAILHTSNGGQDWIPQMYSSNEWFDDYFDSYLEEIPLACQNLDEWTTWNNSPCDFFEDPEISSIYSYSYPNSCRIITNNNLVRFHYSSTTDGNYVISFRLYIPNGKKGYYNIMSEFMYGVGGYKAVEVYFDQGGNGRLLTSDTTNFSYTYDVWQDRDNSKLKR